MEECGWIGDTQRGQNCIYLRYDGIHYNALKLNKDVSIHGMTNAGKTQPTREIVKAGLENKDKRKRGDQLNTSTAQETDIHTTNSTKKTDKNTHMEKSQTGRESTQARRMWGEHMIQRRQQPDKKRGG